MMSGFSTVSLFQSSSHWINAAVADFVFFYGLWAWLSLICGYNILVYVIIISFLTPDVYEKYHPAGSKPFTHTLITCITFPTISFTSSYVHQYTYINFFQFWLCHTYMNRSMCTRVELVLLCRCNSIHLSGKAIH